MTSSMSRRGTSCCTYIVRAIAMKVMTAHALGRSISYPWSSIDRWVKILIERDLVENIDATGRVDPGVRLSGNGIARLDAYFQILIERHFQV